MKRSVLSLLLILTGIVVFAQGYEPGNIASDFDLKNVDGDFVSLSDFEDAKGFVVIFTTNHCPYAVAYEDRIIELDNQFKAKGFPVIAINPNSAEAFPADSYDKMKVRAEEKGFTFPYLHDVNQDIYKEYGATKTPHVFVLSKEKKGLKVAYVGAIDNNYKDASAADEHYVQDAVNSLLAGKTPETTFTKAIGCGIK
jgi:peroxiredoxin